METDENKNVEMDTDESEKESTENINILQESYYAVFFDRKLYIGRVLKCPWLGKVSLKFLHNVGNNLYDWPSRDDIATVKQQYIFMGPLKLIGNGPFQIENHQKILKKFLNLKSKQE